MKRKGIAASRENSSMRKRPSQTNPDKSGLLKTQCKKPLLCASYFSYYYPYWDKFPQGAPLSPFLPPVSLLSTGIFTILYMQICSFKGCVLHLYWLSLQRLAFYLTGYYPS